MRMREGGYKKYPIGPYREKPEMRNCLDCMNCKLFEKSTILRCIKGFWRYYNEEAEKFIVLDINETAYLRFKNRKIFRKAEECPGWE